MAKIEVTIRNPPNPDATTLALYYLYDIFRHSEEGEGDFLYKVSTQEPVRFARYLLDNPEKWQEMQEAGKQAEIEFARHFAERKRK